MSDKAAQGADYEAGQWLLVLVCCARRVGFQVCRTWDDADEFRTDFLDAPGHERAAILETLDKPVRLGFHEVSP
jgi:hypothetical protein